MKRTDRVARLFPSPLTPCGVLLDSEGQVVTRFLWGNRATEVPYPENWWPRPDDIETTVPQRLRRGR